MFRVGSLFSGIGGPELGLERAGHEVLWQCEIDPYAIRVLEKHWPDKLRVGDIRQVDALPPVDLIQGGFPCTNVSQAGKRTGVDVGEESSLWFDMSRILAFNRPTHVLIENPSALLYPGRGFDSIARDLVRLGYNVGWDCIHAHAVGAPHIRDRVWIWASKQDGWFLPRLVERRRWPQEPDEPRAVPSTPEVRQRLRVLGRAAVCEVVRQIGESAKRPLTTDANNCGGPGQRRRSPQLNVFVQPHFPTPTAGDAAFRGQPRAEQNRSRHAMSLHHVLNEERMYPTPVAWDGKRPSSVRRPDDGKRGASLAEETGATEARGLLPNPRFVCWMMDFPLDWFDGV